MGKSREEIIAEKLGGSVGEDTSHNIRNFMRDSNKNYARDGGPKSMSDPVVVAVFEKGNLDEAVLYLAERKELPQPEQYLQVCNSDLMLNGFVVFCGWCIDTRDMSTTRTYVVLVENLSEFHNMDLLLGFNPELSPHTPSKILEDAYVKLFPSEDK